MVDMNNGGQPTDIILAYTGHPLDLIRNTVRRAEACWAPVLLSPVTRS